MHEPGDAAVPGVSRSATARQVVKYRSAAAGRATRSSVDRYSSSMSSADPAASDAPDRCWSPRPAARADGSPHASATGRYSSPAASRLRPGSSSTSRRSTPTQVPHALAARGAPGRRRRHAVVPRAQRRSSLLPLTPVERRVRRRGRHHVGTRRSSLRGRPSNPPRGGLTSSAMAGSCPNPCSLSGCIMQPPREVPTVDRVSR